MKKWMFGLSVLVVLFPLIALGAYNYPPTTSLIDNLKPVVNGTVNILDIFSKTGGAAPDATNAIFVAIPDGNGYTVRSRAANGYLSGTGQIVMADAANYWSKGSLDAEIKTAYLYAIWDADGGIVWALGGYSGFTRVPASVTATDDDFFLLEADSTYTKVITDYCVAVAKIRYQYDTGDDPDHTIQATVLDAPQVVWNPKSDYGKQVNLLSDNTQASDIAEYSILYPVVKQSGAYDIEGAVQGQADAGYTLLWSLIKTGSSTYGSAVERDFSYHAPVTSVVIYGRAVVEAKGVYLNAGDTIHLGGRMVAGAGNERIYSDAYHIGCTHLSFRRAD